MERLFRLLGLMESSQDLHLLYEGLRRSSPKSRAASREILAHTIDRGLRDTLLVLVDDLEDEEKLSRLQVGAEVPSLAGALEQLRADRSEAVRLFADRRLSELEAAGQESPVAIA